MVQVIWDDWDVPHIYADDDDEICYGYGWAMAQAHATRLLELYGLGRGRAAAYWGDAYGYDDELTALIGHVERGQRWADAQCAATKARVAAFCAGVNDYLAEHPEAGAGRREVLPISVADVFAHSVRGLFGFMRLLGDHSAVFPKETFPPPGSNAWGVAGGRTSDGQALLVGNPHLPWSGTYLMFEAHCVSPGRDFYGAGLLGVPWLTMGFNPRAGWVHTVNQIQLMDTYALEHSDGGYLLDGQVLEFEESHHDLEVKGAATREVTRRASVHGPVVTAQDGAVTALRLFGLTHEPCVTGLETWWRMSKAGSVAELFEVLRDGDLPMFNVIASDATGATGAAFAGRPPVRPFGTLMSWVRRLPGHESQWLCDDVYRQDQLPHVLEPENDFVQSTNDPPWTFTWPPRDDDTAHGSTYTAPVTAFPGFRALASLAPFLEQPVFSLADLVELKFCTRANLADHCLDELIRLAEKDPAPELKQAAEVLGEWDGTAAADSRGAVLFFAWLDEVILELTTGQLFAEAWSKDEPFTTPRGLRDPDSCVAALRRACQRLGASGLEVTPGQAWRVRVGGFDVPADGGHSSAGVLKAMLPTPGTPHPAPIVFGDSWTLAVQFSDPPTALGLMAYGNRTEGHTEVTHRQLLMARNSELRPIRLSREEVEAHATTREHLPQPRPLPART